VASPSSLLKGLLIFWVRFFGSILAFGFGGLDKF
jgi:hypothetical protein